MNQDNLSGSFDEVLEALNRVADLIVSNRDLDFTNLEILEKIKNQVKVFAAIVYKLDEERKNLCFETYTKSKLAEKVVNLVNHINIYSIKYPIKAKVLLSKCVRSSQVIISNNLSDFFYPVFKQKRAMDAMQLLMRFGACAAIPIKINNVVMGAFFVVSKKKEFSKPEILLLQLFANFYGMAKTNFNNIESLRKLYETEKETAAILTHELKTPIAIAYNSSAILGQTIEKYGSALKTEFVDKLKTQQLEIQESIIRMNMICNSIFSLTEVENNLSVENQKLDLSNSIGRMVYAYKNFTKKGVAFSYKEKIKKGVYYGPAIQFEQVISIVLENAFKYTKKGYVKMFLNMTGKVMECTITDSGPGISKNEREKIFERFYRSDSTIKVGKGLGLGLYIATKIAAKLGGKIDLMDNPDHRGSRFVVSFPVYKKPNK